MWDGILSDSTTSLLPNIFFLDQNVANCQNTLTVLTLRWRIFKIEATVIVNQKINCSLCYTQSGSGLNIVELSSEIHKLDGIFSVMGHCQHCW